MHRLYPGFAFNQPFGRGGSGHAFVSHVVCPTYPGRQFNGYPFDVSGLEKGISWWEIRMGAAETRDPHSRFGRTPVPQNFVAGPFDKGTLAPHVKEEATFFAKLLFLNTILVVFVPGASLMNHDAVPVQG
jgi:hypothetical protein